MTRHGDTCTARVGDAWQALTWYDIHGDAGRELGIGHGGDWRIIGAYETERDAAAEALAQATADGRRFIGRRTVGRVRFGDILRQHWHGPVEVIREDVSEPEAEAWLAGPEARHATEPGDASPAGTFDHFVARRWRTVS